MESLLKAIEICGGSQSGFAKRITENLPDPAIDPVSSQQVWNWLNRDLIVPAQYCPTIERICDGQVICEQLNHKADWPYIRATQLQANGQTPLKGKP